MPRGGRRAPKPGAAYANRSDLNQRTTLPATAATDQPYGEAGQQIAAQKAVPMGSPAVPPPAAPAQQQPEPTYATPADVPNLGDPTARPGEHVMSGAPSGPGPGPESLTPFMQPLSPLTQGVALLNSLGQHLPPELAAVAKYLNVAQSNGGQGQ